MTVALANLLIQETKDTIYKTGLAVAQAVGLPVTSWQAGDPTRSLFYLESEILSKWESVIAGYVSSGFLDYATGSWLEILAKQVFNVDVPAATYATTDVTLTNGGGGLFTIAAGDVTFKSSISGKTFHNTTGGTLTSGPGTTLTVTVVADEAGSASSAGVGEIDTLVTGLLKVTCTNAVAAIGIDKQSDATTRQQCRDKLGSLSPNGPRDAYSYVARNATLTGTSAVTRVRVYGDSTTGIVTVYLAGPAGGVTEPDRVLVHNAMLQWATPICITLNTIAATNVSVPVTYQLWLYKSANKTAAQVQTEVQAALQTMFASRPIGGDIIPPATTGILSQSLIESTIRALYPQAFRCVVSAPAADVSIGNGQVAALGTITATINIVADP